jgi:hypothetical protein
MDILLERSKTRNRKSMTPKEKAKDLVAQFASVLMHDEVYEDSIKCALIAVDEIIRELTEEISPSVHGFRHQYWIEVEHELEKL